MRAACAVCGNKNPPVWKFVDGRVEDSGLVRVTCPEGHESAVIYNERKYKLLLQSACLAILGGHYRESVSSIAAGLERSFEFYIRAVCMCRELDEGDVAKAWAGISRQSERQLGAFCFLWLLEGRGVFVLPGKVTEFRNKVIHQGYIPGREEVVEYGNQVYALVLAIEAALDQMDQRLVDELQHQSLDRQKAEVPEGMKYLTITPTVVRVAGSEVVGFPESFEDLMVAMSKRFGDG
jgi:hypothetical protein